MSTPDDSNDTIAAVATAPGEAGIAIVRVSGPQALTVADSVFRAHGVQPSDCPGGRFLYGHIRTPSGQPGQEQTLDEGILLVFRAPHSYTREDVAEIQGHGGPRAVQRLLHAVLDAGTRLAEPGEFTRRAFFHGRIDLVQAEAVADLIQAKSNKAATVAVEQMQGRLSNDINKIYTNLLAVAAALESALDFEETDISAAIGANSLTGIQQETEHIRHILASAHEGRLLRQGALLAIAGRPNVGKSTMMNALLGSERAIVSRTPGTTRDTIEETVILDGFPVRLVDTAGLRSTTCAIESEGVHRARAVMKRADSILYMIDSTTLYDDDKLFLSRNSPARTIVVANKTDLGRSIDPRAIRPHRWLPVSLLQGQGISEVQAAILRTLHIHSGTDLHAMMSERQRAMLETALRELEQASRLLQAAYEDHLALVAQHVREAMESLGAITGRTYAQDVLDEIFSRFCIGK